jgi:hypothetical protein
MVKISAHSLIAVAHYVNKKATRFLPCMTEIAFNGLMPVLDHLPANRASTDACRMETGQVDDEASG